MASRIPFILCCIALFSCINAATPSNYQSKVTPGPAEYVSYSPGAYKREYHDERVTIHDTTNARKQNNQSRIKRFAKWLIVRACFLAVVIGVAGLLLKLRGEKGPEHVPKPEPIFSKEELIALEDTRRNLAMSVIEMSKLFGSKFHSPSIIFSRTKDAVEEWKAKVIKRGDDAFANLEADLTLSPEEKKNVAALKEIYIRKIKPLVHYAAPILLDYGKKCLRVAMDEARDKHGFNAKPLSDLLDKVDGKVLVPLNTTDFTGEFLDSLEKKKDTIPKDEYERLHRFGEDCFYIIDPLITLNNIIAPARAKVELFIDKISKRDEVFAFAAVETRGGV